MNETNCLKYLLLACCLLAGKAHAQWTYACSDTLAYHNHQNGELMIQSSTNKLYSIQADQPVNQVEIYNVNGQLLLRR